MFISPADALSILEHYKYLLIFPIAIVEGPIIIIITGFLVYLGYLNMYIAYSVLVVADMIGDSLYYTIGKYWRRSTKIKKYAKFLGYTETSEIFLEKHFKKHTGKTLLLGKISHGLGGTVQIASGIARLPFREFIWWSFLGTIVKVFILFVVGFYIGNSYIKINQYFDSFALITIGIVATVLIFYFVVNKYAKSYLISKD